MKALLLAWGLAGLFGPAAAAPAPADLALAVEAVREVRLLGLRSPSEIKMVMAGIAPDSPQAHLLPGLKAQYDASLKDLLALREEFDKEFSWGHNPGFDYLAGRLRELALKYKAGNCTEQAFLAQAQLRSRGIKAHLVVLETFDWWTMKLDPDKNHVFAVFNLPEGANPAVPGQWGADAVVADPWGRLAGPAAESLRVMLDEIFRLDQSHQKPRYFVLDYERLGRLEGPAAGAPAIAEIPAWGSLPAEPAARAGALRGAVELALAAAPSPMSAASDCAAFSQLWLEKLNGGAGYRLTYAETSGMGTVALAGGGAARRDKTHYFLVDRSFCGAADHCDSEIIIDPTYAQFLDQGDCLYGGTGEACAGAEVLRGLPRVLVGTRAEIKAFYSGLAERVRLYTDGADLPAGKYEAASAASLIYSFGANSGLRANIEILLDSGTEKETP